MTSRLAHLAGLGAALAVSAVTVAGCGATSTTPQASPNASPSPKAPRDVLLAAVPDEKTGPYRFSVKSLDGTIGGIVDASKKTVSIGIAQKESDPAFTLDMKFLIIDQKSWTKIRFTPSNLAGLPRLPQKWMLLDPSKIKDKANSPLAYGDDQSDPAYAHEVLENAAQVTQTGAGKFSGVTDLSLTGVEDIVDDATLKALGAKAKAVPFTASVDAKGHLTALAVHIPAAGKTKAHTYAASYDGYGSTTTPSAPAAGEQTKAVPAVYDMLNS
jgi:hypothetical protein